MSNEVTLFTNMTIKVESFKGWHNQIYFRAWAYNTENEMPVENVTAVTKSLAISGLFDTLSKIAKDKE